MIQALATAVLVFLLCGIFLTILETWLHALTKNPSKNYRIGVLVFSLLVALWAFATSIGR